MLASFFQMLTKLFLFYYYFFFLLSIFFSCLCCVSSYKLTLINWGQLFPLYISDKDLFEHVALFCILVLLMKIYLSKWYHWGLLFVMKTYWIIWYIKHWSVCHRNWRDVYFATENNIFSTISILKCSVILQPDMVQTLYSQVSNELCWTDIFFFLFFRKRWI